MRLSGSMSAVKGGPDTTNCFDKLLRKCVDCKLFRTPPETRSAQPSSLQPPQDSGGLGVTVRAEQSLPLPTLLLGAPVLLGLSLALVLVLVALVTWRQWRLRQPASREAPAREQDKPLDNVVVLSSGSPDATAPVWPPPRENPATTPPAHNVPVPATELGSTELVTTKTAGPEQR